jgi:triacylglycerol lipase
MPFEPDATAFSLANAQLLGQAATIAYQTRDICAAWASANGFPGAALDFFDNRETQGFVVENQDAILVAFRGTQPNRAMDWFVDANAILRQWDHPVGQVHKGFYEALRAVWGVTLPDGRQVLPKRLVSRGRKTVWITGHSLGGALAELCAAQAHFVSHVPIQGVYTFGQPRVGNQAFANALNAAVGTRIFRIVNDRDIVPRVPFFGMGYCHYGNQTFFDNGGARSDAACAVETLAVALKFAAGAFNLAVLPQAGQLARDAAALLRHRRGQTPAEQDEQERALLERAREILRGGVEKIDDHDMVKHYLVRLGTSLPTA